MPSVHINLVRSTRELTRIPKTPRHAAHQVSFFGLYSKLLIILTMHISVWPNVFKILLHKKRVDWHTLFNALTALKQDVGISIASIWVHSSQTYQIHIVLCTQSGLISHTLTALPCPKDLWEEVIHPLGISTLLSASSTLQQWEANL